MAEAPLESWEDLETENEALSNKLGKIKFDGSCESGKGVDGSSESTKVKTSNCNGNGNGLRILPRPTNIQAQCSKAPIAPQVTLEDNTRTQYKPQVRILQRPKGPPAGPKNGQDGETKFSSKSNGNNLITKSYQEREAEYAKVRLRILGSAVPDYKESNLVPLTLSSFSSSTSNTAPVSANTTNTSTTTTNKANGDTDSQQASASKSSETPVVRFPQGPDGSKGFASRR